MRRERSETQKERKSLDTQQQQTIMLICCCDREIIETEKAADFWKKTVGSCNLKFIFNFIFVLHVNLGRCCHYIVVNET
jgi:hypothetical protein